MVANLIQIKDYFGYTNAQEFAADWRKLSAEEKEWFKIEVGLVLGDEA